MSQGPVPLTSQPTHSLHLDDCRRKQSNLTDQLLLFFSFWAYRELIKHNLLVDFSIPLSINIRDKEVIKIIAENPTPKI